ncbi:MAG: methyltransferase domain-containing protein [Chloroflexi bacterium]|nr:methyltransferase domain-containing protein [Chloroflexota bacterium]
MDNEQRKHLYQGIFSRSAATYGQVGPAYFSLFGRRLVEFARIPPGAKVLDVACGRGAVLFPVAETIGPSGEVIGVDFFSASMVAETTREIVERGIPNASVMQMDAEHIQFPDERFDFVLCSFSLFFFPQLKQALAEMRRVLVPGGQLAVATWGKDDERWEWLGKLSEKHLSPEPKEVTETRRGPDLGTPAGVKNTLQASGFRFLRAEIQTEEIAYRSEAEWWSVSWSHGGRQALEEIERKAGPSGLESYKAEAFKRLQAFKTPNGFPERLEVVLSTGQKANSGSLRDAQ